MTSDSLDLKAATSAIDDLTEALDAGHDLRGGPELADLEPDEGVLAVADNYVEPWNRLADEGDRPWLIFSYHRDQGPARSVKATAEHFGIVQSTLWRYSAKYDWVDRLRAFDQHEDRIYNARRATAIKEMAERHGDAIEGYLEALAVPFQALRMKLEEDPDAIANLSESSIKQLIDLSVKSGRIIPSMMQAERLARGMPSEVLEIKGEVTHTHELDRDQLGEVWATLAAAGAFPDGGGAGTAQPALEAEVIEVHPEDGSDVRTEP